MPKFGVGIGGEGPEEGMVHIGTGELAGATWNVGSKLDHQVHSQPMDGAFS
jgi:hypothetical protein